MHGKRPLTGCTFFSRAELPRLPDRRLGSQQHVTSMKEQNRERGAQRSSVLWDTVASSQCLQSPGWGQLALKVFALAGSDLRLLSKRLSG